MGHCWVFIVSVCCFCSLDVSASCPRPCVCQFSSDSNEPTAATCTGLHQKNVSSVLSRLPRNLTSLTLHNSNIASLSDICCFSDLTYLDVSFNRLSNVLAYDAITSYESVRVLNLSHNRIVSLRRDEFISFPSLDYLDLSDNEIMHIDDEAFRLLYLQHMTLKNNRLHYVAERMFRFTPSVIYLDLSKNELTYLHNRNFYYLRKLQSLNISHNVIVTMDEEAFLPLHQLRTLDLSFNNITIIPDRSFTELRWLMDLDLSGNNVRLIEFGFLNNLTIQHLKLEYMDNLRMILSNAFLGTDHLTHISCANSKQLEYISNKSFNNLKNLIALNISYTNLTTFPSGFVNPTLQLTAEGMSRICTCRIPNMQRSLRTLYASVCQHVPTNECSVSLFPSTHRKVLGRLGQTMKLYCASSTYQAVRWKAPNSSDFVDESDRSYSVHEDFLQINSLVFEHNGTFTCSVATSPRVKQRYTVELLLPHLNFTLTVNNLQVVVRWSRAELGSFTNLHQFFLRIRPSLAKTWVISRSLDHLFEIHTFSQLERNRNYTICLQYQPKVAILLSKCLSFRTRSEDAGARFTEGFKYVVSIALVLFAFVLTFYCTRWLYLRFHLYQRERMHSRLQESLSGQDVFASSASLASSRSLSVSYENSKYAEGDDSYELHPQTTRLRDQSSDKPYPHSLSEMHSLRNSCQLEATSC